MIRVGSKVTFAVMPAWVADMPEESRRVFRFCLGRDYVVDGIDEHGHLVLDVSADIDHRFGGFMNEILLEPEYLREVV